MPELPSAVFMKPKVCAKILFEPEAKWRLIDDFGIDSFKEQPEGKLLFTFDFMDADNLFNWLLSFGSQAELLEPVELRELFLAIIRNMVEKYK